MADVGTGTTFSFSGFSGELLSINGNSITREVINTSHMGTEDYHTFLQCDLVDPGELELELAFDPSSPIPITGDSATGTVTFTDASSFASTMICTAWSWGAPLEDKMTATARNDCKHSFIATPRSG